MTVVALAPDPMLSQAVLRHLAAQIQSAGRMLDLVLRQGKAVRARDTDAVLARIAEIKTEMAHRERLEQERTALVGRAGAALGVPGPAVTLDALVTLMPPADGEQARKLSAELRGLLAEIAREHGINRALMRQELAFLDHLVRLVGQEPPTGYAPADADRVPSHRVLDLEA